MKRQSIYQNNLYNTNDTADLGLYGSQWKAKKISFWMCTVPDGAQWTRVEEIVRLIPTMKSLDADKKASKTSEAAPAVAEKAAEKVDFSNVKIEPIFEEMVDDRIPAVNFCKTVNLILEENKIINQSQV